VKLLVVFAAALQLLASCVPPLDPTAPNAHIPALYRSQDVAGDPSIGDQGWWQLFSDPELLALIRTALENNYDARIAAERVIQAQEQFVITNANRYPQINGVAQAPYSSVAGSKPRTQTTDTFQPQGAVAISYELDLFGKLRNASAASQAQILAAEDAREAVLVTLVASLASAYFQLRELDQELEIAQKTVKSRQRQLELNALRLSGGVGTLQDVSQAEQLLAGAQGAVPAIQQSITQTENIISTLTGGYPAPVRRGLPLQAQIAMPAIPATGLPSTLLERRPDIRAAEARLVAARAQVNVARALLFPDVTFGGSAGIAGTSLDGKFYGPQGLYSIIPQLTQPIFNAGSLNANVRLNESLQRQQVLTYLQTVQTSFREVSDALVAYDDQRKVTTSSLALQTSAQKSTELADLRFKGGVTTYLEVLISEQNSFSAELQYVRALLQERLALVQLYQALGGGWQPQTGTG
jgi:multidrug efflux system outer membrane protein